MLLNGIAWAWFDVKGPGKIFCMRLQSAHGNPDAQIEVLLPGGSPVLFAPYRSDCLLSDEFYEPSKSQEDLSYNDLLQLDRLESLYMRWLRAKSVNARSAAMHRAVLEIQPRIADVWVPRWSFRPEDCARQRFRDTLQMIWMLRRRGFDHLVLGDLGLIIGLDGRMPVGDAPVPRTTHRRCEGRSRAPAGSGGGSRRGGSRRGGGDRGDDSGGDGGSDAGGGGSEGASPEPRLWQYLKRLAAIATIAGVLYTPASDLISRFSEDQPIKEIIIKEKVILKDKRPRQERPHRFKRVKIK